MDKEKINNSIQHKDKWTYCPSCGIKLPEIEHQKFCLKCGVDLEYIRRNLTLSYDSIVNYPYRSELINKISDEEILNLGDKKIWGRFTSIGIPIIALALMNLIAAVIIMISLLSTPNIEDYNNLILNPYFTIFTSFTELIFFLIPVYYVGKYLEKTNLNNRLALLGFTFRGYNKYKVIKEILIGLGFAIVGLLLVSVVSIMMEVIIELVFNIDIIYSLSGIDMIIANSDILGLIFLTSTMVLIIGTSEEIAFRGFMQKGLMKSVGRSRGIIITAVIFSMIHLLGIFLLSDSEPITYLIYFLLNFFPYFALSIMLGLLYYWRKENLIAVVITHGFYNAFTIILAYLYFSII